LSNNRIQATFDSIQPRNDVWHRVATSVWRSAVKTIAARWTHWAIGKGRAAG
jgi:hypothetical protein